ncbi:MAG TPA: filamentous hemagglutinin N-terminal domain-containing protein, partial [Burkholderiales bacterium]|nr:filamentous hemagglutinin N-terminal domain-containing protein [Burkholderiales bacterium]
MNKRHRSPMPLRVKAVTLAVASCFAVSVQTPAFANPTGFAVVNGQVTFNYNGNTLNVTNTPGSIINWQRFSIGTNELTRFIQQSASSSVLNRVVGIDPSLILGALQSNGRVFLVNPNGILFGAGAQIDVGGLVASTLNLSNQDFLAGRLRFTDTPGAGSVVNNAAITTPTGGQVYLIAPSVQNSGIITSPQGEVILAAGRSVELVDAGTPNLRVEITAPDTEAVNVGQIIANSGKIGIYAGLIRNSGVIRADGVVLGEHGEILLKATGNTNLESGGVVAANGAQGGNITIQSGDTTLISGVVEAKGSEGQGGSVQLLGNNVGVLDGARIDASGQAGGGTVLVGGDYQGRNPDIQNAFRTYVGSDASIRADAIASGDGGKVIVWSDDATRMYGNISARGGAQSGNGGFVETSGHSLEVTRGPDVSAPAGTGGTWLLDPVDLNLVAGDAVVGSTLINNAGAPFFSPLGDTSTVSVDLINSQLNLGSNVTLTTTSQGPTAGTQLGNITVSAPIVKSAATILGPGGVVIGPTGPGGVLIGPIGTTTLSMQAHNNIVINPGGSITSTGDPLNVLLQADLDGIGGGGVTLGGGIFTNGGVVSIAGRDLTAINAPINTMRTITSAGSVSLQSVANAVNVSSAITGGSFFANGSTGVSINAPVTTLGGGGVQLFSSTGPVTVAAAISGGFFSANAGGASTLNLAAPITSTGATLTSDNLQITAPLNAGTGGITAQQNTAGAAINFGASGQAQLDNMITSGPLTIGNSSSGAMTVNAPISAGHSSVTFNSGTSFALNPGATLATTSPLTINAPVITLNGPVNAQNVTFSTDSIAVNSAVTSVTDINISTRSFGRPVNLGVAADSATSLDFTTAELGNLVNGGSNALRVTATGGALTVQGPISRTGAQSLALTGSSIGQASGATLNVTNLKLTGLFGSVILPEANTVGTLAGTAAGVGGQFTFTEAAGTPLTIGAVDGTNGLR